MAVANFSLEHVMSERLTIDRLGARGNGIAILDGVQIFVAGALPGETVIANREGTRAEISELLSPSPERNEPFCPHHATCGGCSARHMSPSLYQAWKTTIVSTALRQNGIEADIDLLQNAHGAGRRRVTLHVRLKDGNIEAGFMEARSHRLIAIDRCPVCVPALDRTPEIARRLATALGRDGKPVGMQATATESGIDIDIRGHGPISKKMKQRLIVLANELDLARLALHGDVLIERKAPFIRMGSAVVVPPAGGFLQATERGEAILSEYVISFCGGAKKVADLFSGCGPFSLRLAEKAEVYAVETDKDSLAALDRAYRMTQGLRRVTTEIRDLFRRPLLKPELDRFDAIVMDPPRAGAKAQALQIAQSSVGTIVSVSCDAGTFARDAAILISGGYKIERVVPVDQFAYSAHVESVALFTKSQKKKKIRAHISSVPLFKQASLGLRTGCPDPRRLSNWQAASLPPGEWRHPVPIPFAAIRHHPAGHR